MISKEAKISAMNKDELKHKMRMKGVDNLSELENGGHRTETNRGGTAILINETGEMVFYQEIFGGEKSEIKTAKIEYDAEGKAYFLKENESWPACQHNLNEFMRNNYGAEGIT